VIFHREVGFTLNGSPIAVTSFVPVPDAPGWLAGEYEFSWREVPVNTTTVFRKLNRDDSLKHNK